MPDGRTVVCIGVCTVGRPGMLANCLNSLAGQNDAANLDVHIAVVDNDAEPTSRDIVESFAVSCPFPVHYRHEPRRGIPMARNRVLEEALSLDAVWLIFIDDDQIAGATFVSKHLEAARLYEADVVQPKIYGIFPDPAPFWCLGVNEAAPAVPVRERGDGQPIRSAGTGGTLMSMRLVRPDGFNLRFDERLALGGGEDSAFFHAASLAGATMVKSSLPIVSEEASASRLTYLRYCLRGTARGGYLVADYRNKHGGRRALRKFAGATVIRILRGIGQLAVSPIFIPFDIRRFKFTALEGGRNIFLAAGQAGGLLGRPYEYYRRIDGY